MTNEIIYMLEKFNIHIFQIEYGRIRMDGDIFVSFRCNLCNTIHNKKLNQIFIDTICGCRK